MLAPPKTFALTHPIEKKVVFDTKSINCEVSASFFRCGPLLSAGTASDFAHRTYSCHITKTYHPPLNLGYPKKICLSITANGIYSLYGGFVCTSSFLRPPG